MLALFKENKLYLLYLKDSEWHKYKQVLFKT